MNAGEKVSVQLAGHSAETTADENGNWKVSLDALEAGGDSLAAIDAAGNLLRGIREGIDKVAS